MIFNGKTLTAKGEFSITTADLPTLENPASESDVLQGKEYIDAAGEKKAGTFVDEIHEVERIVGVGGVSIEVESTAGASALFTFEESNLQPENIKKGASIFGVEGSAKELRVESGTITPAEGTKTIAIPCSNGAKAFCIAVGEDSLRAIESQSNIYVVSVDANFDGKIDVSINSVMCIWYKTQYANGAFDAQNAEGVTLSPQYAFYPCEYTWTAYYWEDIA